MAIVHRQAIDASDAASIGIEIGEGTAVSEW